MQIKDLVGNLLGSQFISSVLLIVVANVLRISAERYLRPRTNDT